MPRNPSEVDAALSALDASLSALRKRVLALEPRTDERELDAAEDATGTRAGLVEENVRLRGEVTRLRERVSSLEGECAAADVRAQECALRCGELEASNARWAAMCAAAEHEASEYKAEIATVRRELGAAGTEMLSEAARRLLANHAAVAAELADKRAAAPQPVFGERARP